MSRLILISNRLPITVKVQGDGGLQVVPSAGGLATGLSRSHGNRGGLWIGWPGDVSRLDEAARAQLDTELANLRCVPLHLTADQVLRYYEGYANRVLWPVFHSMPESVPLEGRHYATYHQVNQRFADAVVEHWRPGDTIWVHDYQLLLVPGMIRERLPDARIGFFLHIPFPPFDVFRTLPWRAELLRGLLGADLVGFHTAEFLDNFTSTLHALLDLEVSGTEVHLPEGRVVEVGDFPMGIDAEWFESLALDPQVRAEATAIREAAHARGQALVLGVDRLDYTKGIPHRLLALGRLLEQSEEHRGHIRMLQFAVPSRENVETYEAVRRQVEMLTSRINSRFGGNEEVPIHYLYRGSTPRQLVALYAAADVMMVTPLRDGMNLVAKEFVACRIDLDGVLILSELAGAAAEMPEALLINPYDIDQVARALRRALAMPREERGRRMDALRRQVREKDVHWWADEFLSRLDGLGTARLTAPLVDAIAAQVQTASARLLLLDYDGTLVPLVPRPEMAAPDAELLELLRQLAAQPGTSVHVVSGRPREVLDEWLGALPIALHAEHGLWSRVARDGAWHRLAGIATDWMERVRPLLEEFSARTAGTFFEEKSASLAWHYRLAPDDVGASEASLLQSRLNQLLNDEGLGEAVNVMAGNKVIEVRVHGVHKGRVVEALVRELRGNPLILAAGDDRTDEDTFAALPRGAIAVHVGPQPSQAPLRLATPEELRSLLWALLEPEAHAEAQPSAPN